MSETCLGAQRVNNIQHVRLDQQLENDLEQLVVPFIQRMDGFGDLIIHGVDDGEIDAPVGFATHEINRHRQRLHCSFDLRDDVAQ